MLAGSYLIGCLLLTSVLLSLISIVWVQDEVSVSFTSVSSLFPLPAIHSW